MWWIKASIQEYVLRSWSLVKMGTTTAQKKLFFNLKKLKNQIAPGQDGDLKDEQVNEISKRLDVDSHEVINMNRRMMGQEKSLNDPIKNGETDEWQDWLVDDSLDQELVFSQKQEYVLRSWSLVKMGTTTAQKKLFFNLKKLKNQIAPNQDGDLKDDQVKEISKRLDVESHEVVNMNRRMMGQEKSLNDPIKSGESDEWQDWLVDDRLDQELIVSQKQEYDDKKELLESAMKILNEREKEIITARRLSEEPETLEDLSKKYKISRERIRQIETKAFEKLQKSMINASKSKNLLPAN